MAFKVLLFTIKNHFSSRHQFVGINNTFSSSKPINIGVSQGSVLRLLHFLICMNDTPVALNVFSRRFADDTYLIPKIRFFNAKKKP